MNNGANASRRDGGIDPTIMMLMQQQQQQQQQAMQAQTMMMMMMFGPGRSQRMPAYGGASMSDGVPVGDYAAAPPSALRVRLPPLPLLRAACPS